ncbi:MFS transporter [Limnohabitans sp. 15K]|nr:MFS transporter [Limnohabitans sp. 15K]
MTSKRKPVHSGSAPLRELWAQRGYVRFLLARISGLTANQMLMVAVAWHMYDLTSSAWDLGLVGLFQFVPALLFALPAGHVVDRFHRGRIFALCVFVQAMVAVLLVCSLEWHFASRGLILAISVLLGMTRAFQMPAQQALTPTLVPQHLLPRAVALSSGSVQLAIIAGPALGGIIYAQGPVSVYLTAGAMLLLAALLSLFVHYPHRASTQAATLRHLLAGLVFVWRHKVLLGATSLDMFAVLLGGATALLPIYARDILHVGPEGLGVLRAAPAVGALLMSLALTRWPLERRVGPKLLMAVAVFGLATVAFGLSQSFWLSVMALAVTGAADNISVVVRLTVMQLETPDEMRGRVAAVNSIFIGASNQLGEFESGSVAALWGPEFSVISGGVGTVMVAALWLRLFPGLARRDHLRAAGS